MANQKTPTTDTVEDYTVEKVILSGSPFVSSILGPGAYRITADLAPSFYTAPVVTGWPVVPTTLYCDEGSFNSSPRGVLTYQWYYDDMLMDGEIENFLEIDDSDVNTFYTGADVLNDYPTFAGTQTSHVIMPAADLPVSAITVEFWVKTANANQAGMFSYASATEFNEFTIFNAANMQLLIGGTNQSSGISIANGEWRHIAATWQSSDGATRMYIDGVMVWSFTANAGETLDIGGIIILAQEQDAFGGGFDPAQVLDGDMCEVRVWDHVRTENQINDNANDALVGNEAGLVYYWPLDEGAGSVATDQAGTLDGVYSNVTWNFADGPVYIERIVVINVGTDEPYHCKVTSTNALGSDVGRSNDKLLELVEPGYVYEFDANFITGLNAPGRLDLNVAATCIISGFAHDMKCDVNLGVMLVLKGFQNDVKADVNTGEINVITGMVGIMKLDISEMEADIITGLQSEYVDINAADAYVVQTFEDMGPLALLNGDASAANMDDWTMEIGSVSMVTSAPGWSFNTGRTGAIFKGEDRAGSGLDSQMSQVVVLDAGILTDVDLGRIHAKTSFSFYALRHYDGVQITLEALNAADGVLNTITGPLRKYANVGAFDDLGWIRRIADNDPLSLPTLTRKIKVTILFEMDDTTGTDNNGYIDNIVVDLLKLE